MDAKEAFFDLGKWHGALIFSSGKFRDFRGYLENSNAIELHISTKVITSVNEQGDLTHRQLSGDLLYNKISNEYKESYSDSLVLHANMLIVMAGSYFENMVFDFLRNYFIHKPKSLHKFLGSDGYIKVTEVFSYDALSDLITDLAARGAKNAASGSPSLIFRRVRSLTKCDIPNELERKIVKLIEKRNEIVHDIKEYPIDAVDIEGAYETLQELLKKLGLITRDLNLPLFDPGSLLS